MKRLHLTAVKRILNEEAQKRLDEFDDEDDYVEPRDEHGRTAEFYEDLNLPVPQDLRNKKSEYLQFDLEKDYDEFEIDVTVRMSSFLMAVDNEDYGCIVYLKGGVNIEVIDDSDDINAQIWWHTRSRWEKIKEFFHEIKSKFKRSTTNNN